MADSPESENFFGVAWLSYAMLARQILIEISSKSGTSAPSSLSERGLESAASGQALPSLKSCL
jgi:hypothetical protein